MARYTPLSEEGYYREESLGTIDPEGEDTTSSFDVSAFSNVIIVFNLDDYASPDVLEIQGSNDGTNWSRIPLNEADATPNLVLNGDLIITTLAGIYMVRFRPRTIYVRVHVATINGNVITFTGRGGN